MGHEDLKSSFLPPILNEFNIKRFLNFKYLLYLFYRIEENIRSRSKKRISLTRAVDILVYSCFVGGLIYCLTGGDPKNLMKYLYVIKKRNCLYFIWIKSNCMNNRYFQYDFFSWNFVDLHHLK